MISIKRHPIFKIENFLSTQENQSILDYAISHKKDFKPSGVTTKVDNFRKSQTLYKFPQSKDFLSRIKCFIPTVTESLWLGIADFNKIECQMTTHGEGDFFKLHTDSDKTCEDRILTYVYYFHKTPKSFASGELIVYDSLLKQELEAASSFQSIEPINNSLVFFDSKSFHEVLPVRVPSGLFEDNRFTINGWIHESNLDDLQPSLAIIS